MAKVVKLKPQKEEEIDVFDGLNAEDVAVLKKQGIRNYDDLFNTLALMGIDPMKIYERAATGEEFDEENFTQDDFAFDEGNEVGEMFRQLAEMPYDKLPEGLLIPIIPAKDKEYYLRIKLNNSPVKVWRELKVPANMSLELLALFLIHAMGWENRHLHQFRNKDVLFKSKKDIAEAEQMFGKNSRYLDADEMPLAWVLSRKGDRIKFEYDFGDSWEHDVWLKGIREYAPGEEPTVQLVKGVGCCPPEDCGGVWGYEELLRIREKKRKTKDEKERLGWHGIDTHYDPNDFDAEFVNEELADLWEYVLEEIEERKK